MRLRRSRRLTLEFEKNMKLGPSAFLLFLSLFCSLCVARAAPAGYDEGYAAYQTHDYASALADWKPLAEQGDLHAQYALWTMHKEGEVFPRTGSKPCTGSAKPPNRDTPHLNMNWGRSI